MVLSTFDEQTYKNATLFVPKGCKSIYWLHPDWENFAKIEEKRIITVEDITNLIDNYLEEGSNIKLDEITSLIDLFLTQQAESKLRGFE